MEKRDFSWVDFIYSDNFGLKADQIENPGAAMGTGKIGIKLYLNTFIQAFEDIKYAFLNILESDDQVVIRWKLTAKHTGELFSIEATNKTINVVGVSWFFFDEQDLIRITHLIWNGFTLMDQLDLEVRPKE